MRQEASEEERGRQQLRAHGCVEWMLSRPAGEIQFLFPPFTSAFQAKFFGYEPN